MHDFKEYEQELTDKKIFIVYWLVETLVIKSIDMPQKFWIDLKWKQWKDRIICTQNVMSYCKLMHFKNCNLCLSHYLSEMLSMTKVELDPISDIDMSLLFEKRM